MEQDKQAAPAATVAVRILVDHQEGETKYGCNTVVTLDAKKAASMVKAGIADDDVDAVQAGYKAMAEREVRDKTIG